MSTVHAAHDARETGASGESRKVGRQASATTVVVTMPPRACTSAMQVRQACEWAMEVAAIGEREAVVLAEIQVRTNELARLRTARVQLATGLGGFLDGAAERLDTAERTNRYYKIPEPSEAPNRKRLTACAIQYLDVLADNGKRREHSQARGALWSLFDLYGGLEALEPYQLGKSRTLSITAEHRLWLAESATQASA